MNQTVRAFIAFGISNALRGHIRSIQERIKTYRFPIRWVRPEAVHLTMKFLGNIRSSNVKTIGSLLKASVMTCEPMHLGVKGIGVFPDARRPRVLWVGLCGDVDALAAMHRRLNDDLAAVGYAEDHRPFKGHLTLGRVKGRIHSRKLIDAMKTFENFESEPFVADRLIMYQSDLRPSGAVYTELISVDLCRRR